MSESNVPKLGKLIGQGELVYRDAVHVAVIPVVALQRMRAGDRVGIDGAGRACFSDNQVGIVDPYLDCYWVEPGERFYLFMYPGTVTGLRHAWTHPAFASRLPNREEGQQG